MMFLPVTNRLCESMIGAMATCARAPSCVVVSSDQPERADLWRIQAEVGALSLK
jgi:hypothetical protein